MLSGAEHLDQAIRLTVHLILLPSDVYIGFLDVDISCLQSLQAASERKKIPSCLLIFWPAVQLGILKHTAWHCPPLSF